MTSEKMRPETSRESWLKDTKKSSYSAGDRIWLFWEISRQAKEVIKNDVRETETIRSELSGLCRSPVTKKLVGLAKVPAYLRLANLKSDEVKKLAKDADCKADLEDSGHKSRVTISHVLLLAAVTSKRMRKKLIDEMLAQHWSQRVLKENARNALAQSQEDGKETPPRKKIRHRVTVNSLTTVTAKLDKLLDELDDNFAETIGQSDRRTQENTRDKLDQLTQTFRDIQAKLKSTQKFAKKAAGKLNEQLPKAAAQKSPAEKSSNAKRSQQG